MQASTDAEPHGMRMSQPRAIGSAISQSTSPVLRLARAVASSPLPWQLTLTFLAYFCAGKLGQATTNIRSSNLGPVWPAFGIAVAAFLAYGYRVWPAIAASAFVIAAEGAVPFVGAAGQAIGATIGAAGSMVLLRRIPGFDPALSRLRDAVGFVVLGAFGGAILSSVIGTASLYATGIQAYSGLTAAWFIYWLGDSTGVLLVTPILFTLPTLLRIRSRASITEMVALAVVIAATCLLLFGDLPLIPIRLHALAFAVVPLVMWGAIRFGIAGAALSVFEIATFATLLTALGHGPFSANTPFTNAVLLDVLFIVLSLSGLTLAAVIAEREQSEHARAQLIRERTATEARLRLAAIVESSHDAIVSTDLDGIVQSWNAAAERIFGFSADEVVGRPITVIFPPDRKDEDKRIRQSLKTGERLLQFETTRMTKTGVTLTVSLTASPLRDASGRLVGTARILRDITEQKRATEALSRVSGMLIAAQEEERSRIARELHDDIGQRLALLSVQLAGAGPYNSPDARTNIERQIRELASAVQSLSHELHSSKLELLGVAASMKRFCEELNEQYDVKVDFTAREIPRHLPWNVSLTLFRILQEATHNWMKHSGVPKCDVTLWHEEGWVNLVVGDRGRGFEPAVVKTGRGLGLISMEERVKLVGGQLSIESRPQKGTTIHARVPSAPPDAVISA
jgi:PAS domain S-box-containing protein